MAKAMITGNITRAALETRTSATVRMKSFFCGMARVASNRKERWRTTLRSAAESLMESSLVTPNGLLIVRPPRRLAVLRHPGLR
ncbi:hypothetical protein D3C74_459260 [compost metagenome]